MICSIASIQRALKRSLNVYILAFEEEAEMLTLAEASKLTLYTQEYLSLLTRKDNIDAFKLQRNWIITKKY